MFQRISESFGMQMGTFGGVEPADLRWALFSTAQGINAIHTPTEESLGSIGHCERAFAYSSETLGRQSPSCGLSGALSASALYLSSFVGPCQWTGEKSSRKRKEKEVCQRCDAPSYMSRYLGGVREKLDALGEIRTRE